MAGYSKEFLVDAFIHHYSVVLETYAKERAEKFFEMVDKFYDTVGRDQFRLYCSLDAEALRKFKLETRS